MVRKNALNGDRYEKKTSGDKYYFNLNSSNGQVLGTSEKYDTGSARNEGIELLKSTASTAVVED